MKMSEKFKKIEEGLVVKVDSSYYKMVNGHVAEWDSHYQEWVHSNVPVSRFARSRNFDVVVPPDEDYPRRKRFRYVPSCFTCVRTRANCPLKPSDLANQRSAVCDDYHEPCISLLEVR
jgi:hypothetical protein